jgi:hypothetical protein
LRTEYPGELGSGSQQYLAWLNYVLTRVSSTLLEVGHGRFRSRRYRADPLPLTAFLLHVQYLVHTSPLPGTQLWTTLTQNLPVTLLTTSSEGEEEWKPTHDLETNPGASIQWGSMWLSSIFKIRQHSPLNIPRGLVLTYPPSPHGYRICRCSPHAKWHSICVAAIHILSYTVNHL